INYTTRFLLRIDPKQHVHEAPESGIRASRVPLSLSLCAVAQGNKKLRRAAAAGSREFVCKTCSRSFPTFQALGGHRTSHLRARHGLALALAGDHYSDKPNCNVCGLEFEMGQALGGHMRRHRDEAAAVAPPVLLRLFV
ncbi:uncharacterized protein, partial [Lolium perenne]|uniref:uncharacterized protein n=1 Tax=Lolium perenne TaxID=4522 RepID=UPI003A99BEE1